MRRCALRAADVTCNNASKHCSSVRVYGQGTSSLSSFLTLILTTAIGLTVIRGAHLGLDFDGYRSPGIPRAITASPPRSLAALAGLAFTHASPPSPPCVPSPLLDTRGSEFARLPMCAAHRKHHLCRDLAVWCTLTMRRRVLLAAAGALRPVPAHGAAFRRMLSVNVLQGFEVLTTLNLDHDDGYSQVVRVSRAIKHGNAVRGPNPQLRALFYRVARMQSQPIRVVFFFDGDERHSIKRGTKVLTRGHWLTEPFKELIEAFGYHWHMAPGEADAELAQLSDMAVVDVVVTPDLDALVFGARALMTFPNKKKDKDEITLYTSENIFVTPDVSLTRGGLLLVALLSGGDQHKGLPGCGVGLARAVAQTFLQFLSAWKIALALEFRTESHGYLGRKCKALAEKIDASPVFPDLDVLYLYTHPITSRSRNTIPAYQSWGVAVPKFSKIASLCEARFSWEPAQISSKFTKCVYPGIAMQALLQPYNLQTLLEAHVTLGSAADDAILPRSSVLLEISIGALNLQVKSGLAEPKALPTPALMRIWFPAQILDRAVPDLASRSKTFAKLHKSRSKVQKPSKASYSRTNCRGWSIDNFRARRSAVRTCFTSIHGANVSTDLGAGSHKGSG
ncbi:hypothetical protein C8R47DRAFT_1229291 [Mycena vitilis]|nr:hypothetical protein C8R47DRAFT_1229291 [Mycena vitilis]